MALTKTFFFVFTALLVIQCMIGDVASKKNRVTINNQQSIQKKSGEPSQPGFMFTVTQNGINYLTQIGVQKLMGSIGTLSIPDVSGEDDSDIGKIDYSITSITLSGVSFPTNSITINPGVGLNLAISGGSAQLSFGWHYKKVHFPHTSDTGTGDASASGINIAVTIAITQNSNRPFLTVVGCAVNIGDVDIKLHGGASWLYNFFLHVFHSQIVNSIANALQNALPGLIQNGANQGLSTMPIQQKVGPNAVIDYGLIQNPVFGSGFMTLPESGEILAPGGADCPGNICPQVAIPQSLNSQMIQIMVSEYVANSACYAYFEQNLLSAIVTANEVPSYSPIQLNTTSLEYILPTLYAQYPNMLIQLHAYATSSPAVTFAPTGISANILANIEVDVVNGSNLVNAFVLNSTSVLAANALISGSSVVINVTTVEATLDVYSSNIGPVNVLILNKLVDLAISSGVIPYANKMLANGFSLPQIPGVTFSAPAISFGTNFMAITTDFSYAPPTTF